MARCTTRSRAVDHKGKVQESFAIKQWDKATAVKFIKNAMKQPGRPKAIVTDGLCSYGAALKEFGASHLQENARAGSTTELRILTCVFDEESERSLAFAGSQPWRRYASPIWCSPS
jgi:transposase-like protein